MVFSNWWLLYSTMQEPCFLHGKSNNRNSKLLLHSHGGDLALFYLLYETRPSDSSLVTCTQHNNSRNWMQLHISMTRVGGQNTTLIWSADIMTIVFCVPAWHYCMREHYWCLPRSQSENEITSYSLGAKI